MIFERWASIGGIQQIGTISLETCNTDKNEFVIMATYWYQFGNRPLPPPCPQQIMAG